MQSTKFYGEEYILSKAKYATDVSVTYYMTGDTWNTELGVSNYGVPVKYVKSNDALYYPNLTTYLYKSTLDGREFVLLGDSQLFVPVLNTSEAEQHESNRQQLITCLEQINVLIDQTKHKLIDEDMMIISQLSNVIKKISSNY